MRLMSQGSLKTILPRFQAALFPVATVFFTPSGENTKTQIKPFGYRSQ